MFTTCLFFHQSQLRDRSQTFVKGVRGCAKKKNRENKCLPPSDPMKVILTQF